MDGHRLEMLQAMGEALLALDVAVADLRFADVALALYDGPSWDAVAVDRYVTARDAFTEAYETVQAYAAYM